MTAALPVADEVNVAEQVDCPKFSPVPGTKLHGLPVKDAPLVIPVWLNVTVPVGLTVTVAKSESVTAAVHVDVPPTMIVFGAQFTVVEVALSVTVTLVVPGVPDR